ncbi:MAG TPA: hypothetical protein VFI91_14250, partial [Longimicrobiaceae bacterium]|nr:hypothetical protein [Longimicrobiaceae bacterium]
LGVPLYSYSGLLVSAGGAWAADRLVCALFDARRRDVYAACYRFGKGEVEVVMGACALSLDEVVGRFEGDEVPVFTGEGAVLHAAELQERLGAMVVPSLLSAPRAAVLLWLVNAEPELGLVADAAAWEPDYVRASGAERIAAQKS